MKKEDRNWQLFLRENSRKKGGDPRSVIDCWTESENLWVVIEYCGRRVMAKAGGGITNAVNVGIAVQADWENREFISHISLNVRRLFEFLVQFGNFLAFLRVGFWVWLLNLETFLVFRWKVCSFFMFEI